MIANLERKKRDRDILLNEAVSCYDYIVSVIDECGRMTLAGGNEVMEEMPDLRGNPGLPGQKQVTNRLKRGKV
jgi:hypothetical protein